MSAPASRAGSWFWTDTLNVAFDEAAIPLNEWFCACQARKSGAEDPLFPTPCEINVDQTNTNLLASLYGRLSSKTAFTTEKIAVFAPIPSASVRMATAANPGFFRSIRRPNRISCSRSASLSPPLRFRSRCSLITSRTGAGTRATTGRSAR